MVTHLPVLIRREAAGLVIAGQCLACEHPLDSHGPDARIRCDLPGTGSLCLADW